MSFFSAFAASFGSMLLMAALIASWLFRSSCAPLVAKIVVPTLIVALACATPYQVNAMLGFPISAPLATLPAHAELIAFVAQDDDTRVDLWLRQGDAPPRAYETALDNKLKRTLREAQSRLGHGERVMLVKARPDASEPASSSSAHRTIPDTSWTIPSSRCLQKADSSARIATSSLCGPNLRRAHRRHRRHIYRSLATSIPRPSFATTRPFRPHQLAKHRPRWQRDPIQESPGGVQAFCLFCLGNFEGGPSAADRHHRRPRFSDLIPGSKTPLLRQAELFRRLAGRSPSSWPTSTLKLISLR